MIQIMKSYQASPVWNGKLRVVGENVSEGSRKQKSFQTPRKYRQRQGRDHQFLFSYVFSSVYFTFYTITMSLLLTHDLHARLLRVVQ